MLLIVSEKCMKIEAGLWIDHRQAVIVRLRDHEEELSQILSHVGKHTRFSGASNAPPSTDVPDDRGEDIRDRQFASRLDQYYAEVIARLSDAASILILGPGEAKTELEVRLKSRKRGSRIVGIETADKMTDAQIGAKVRSYFRK